MRVCVYPGFNQKLFAAGWGLGSESRQSAQQKRDRQAKGTAALGDDGETKEGEEDIWAGPQTVEYIRPLDPAFAVAQFGSRELATVSDLRGVITEGDVLRAGQEMCKVKAVLRDCIVLEEPYMGGFVGKELRLAIIEQVVKGQPPATDDERAERLDPVRGDLVRALCSLLSALCSLLSALCSLLSALCSLLSALCSLLSAVLSLDSCLVVRQRAFGLCCRGCADGYVFPIADSP